ncbi:ARF GTPase-activating protein [Sarcoptes scabiei]|nr:ARF GTPase-activating protein [Sarcoptes scabiei]
MDRRSPFEKKMKALKNFAKNVKKNENFSKEQWFENIIRYITNNFEARMPYGGYRILNKVYSKRYRQNLTLKQFQRKYNYHKFQSLQEGYKRRTIEALLNEDSSSSSTEEEKERVES